MFKTGPWGQGPVFLQQLALLDGLELGPFLGVEHVHAVIECAKLAFADREAFYGDSAPRCRWSGCSRAPYADERRALVGADGVRRAAARRRAAAVGAARARRRRAGVGEPTRGDTCHLDVADRFGNLVSATPSGGWLQSSPALPGLGFCLGTRAQMFWLEEGLPASLVRRPAAAHDALALAGARTRTARCSRSARPAATSRTSGRSSSSSPTPCSGSTCRPRSTRRCSTPTHFPSSFYPRAAEPRRVEIEGRAPAATIAALRERGHDVVVVDDWSLGRLSAVSRAPDGLLRGAANPRGMQGYAVGR